MNTSLANRRSTEDADRAREPVLVLHAGLLGANLVVWAEASAVDGDVPPRFGSHAELEGLLSRIGAFAFSRSDDVVAWLPAMQGRRAAAAAHAPHRVDALSLEPASTIALIRTCGSHPRSPSACLIGRDLAFWHRLLQYAARLVAERRYLPSLEIARDGKRAAAVASWRPRVDAAARAELTKLAAAMPSACRALVRDGAAAPTLAPLDVAMRFVAVAVDQLVRSATARVVSGAAADTLHDRWLNALCSEDRGERPIVATGAEGSAFAALVGEWVRETTRDDEAEYRLCLRLEEPHDDRPRWLVRYLLQSNTDPSLIVDLTSVWKNAPLRERFLEAIGKAAAFSPLVEATLREAKPEGYELDDPGAHRFLTRDAALFDGAGYGILLPSWWTGHGAKAKLTIRGHAKRTSRAGSGMGLRLDELVAVNWTVALGGQPFTKGELAEIARLKAPLINVRGQWVIVDAQEIRAAIDLLGGRGQQTMPLRELTTMAWTGRSPAANLAVEEVTASGALGGLLDRLLGRATFEEQPIPEGLRGTLRPYQVRGYSWLHFLSRLGLGSCLADDMGLGKSITTLALLARDWERDASAPVLLVCPTSVIGNWQREIARFTPHLPVVVHHGGDRTREGRLLKRNERVAIVLTSYGVLLRDRALLGKVPWRGVVLDEAQNIKNAESKQFQAACGIEAGYRVALTGTPIENHVGELWALMEFLNPGLLGSAASFRREFQIPIAAYGDEEAESRLRRTTAPFILRRLKSDPTVIADLPKKLEMRVFCQLTKEQASLYAAVLRDVEQQLEEAKGIERRGLILATLTKLKQVCNHPAHLLRDNSALQGRSGKLARLAEMLEEVDASGEHALIFTQFTEMAQLLQRSLQATTGREVLYLHGGLSRSTRDRIVERFQNGVDAPTAFILSLRAGGTGLNLTRANHVFHFDRWWNPAVEQQASDRAYRIGQTKNVQVHRLICAGTVEEKIDAMLERKGALANRLVRSGEAGLTELSNEQLRDLFALNEGSVIDG